MGAHERFYGIPRENKGTERDTASPGFGICQVLVMADQVVLRFVHENDFENKGNDIYADVLRSRLPFKSQSVNNFCGIDS